MQHRKRPKKQACQLQRQSYGQNVQHIFYLRFRLQYVQLSIRLHAQQDPSKTDRIIRRLDLLRKLHSALLPHLIHRLHNHD